MTMNLKPMVKHQLRDYWTSGLIFFLVNVAMVLLAFITAQTFAGNASYTGYGFACGIFMLVMGIVLPRQSMRLGIQMSISRKTSFLGLLISSAVASLGLALAGDLLLALSQNVANPIGGLVFADIYGLIYAETATSTTAAEHFRSVLFNACFMLVNFALGLFFTFLFWRLGKVGQLLAALAIPVVLIGLPIAVATFEVPLAPITRLIEKLVNACITSAWTTMGVFLLGAAIFTIISWFLICRTNIRGTALK